MPGNTNPPHSVQSPVVPQQAQAVPLRGIDRDRVRSSFDSHADEYETLASVQRRVVDRLTSIITVAGESPTTILDIGCGTGMLLRRLADCYPGASLSGIDLAPGMAAHSRQALSGVAGIAIVVGDAEELPFPTGRFDLVVSTSTFQWLETLDAAFTEAARVLAPGGTFRFALFGEGTLRELKESYREALARHGAASDRTHRFLGVEPVKQALERAAFRGIRVWSEDEIEEHPDVPTLLRSLKRIGAGNATPGHPTGLGERRVMLTMMAIYEERYRRGEMIPATYQVIYGEGRKQ